MFSRTSVAFLLPLLMAAILLAGCAATVSDSLNQARLSGSGLLKNARELERQVGETVTRVQSGATIIVNGVQQIQSGAVKISVGKEIILGAGSGMKK